MITPTTKFADLPRKGHSHGRVSEMTEEQCRYALWALCTAVLGSDLGGAVNRCIADHLGNSNCQHMNEATVILAGLALPKVDPAKLAEAEKRVRALHN